MNRGVPPTARKARTGEFTPPGVTARARSNRACEAWNEVTRRFSQATGRTGGLGTGTVDPPNIGAVRISPSRRRQSGLGSTGPVGRTHEDGGTLCATRYDG